MAIFDPTLHTATNKPIGLRGKPVDARTYYYDDGNSYRYRPYMSIQQVLDYLPLADDRRGNFEVIINTNGTINDGYIIGGTNNAYWFKDGLADNNLVLKIPNVDLSGYYTSIQVDQKLDQKLGKLETAANSDKIGGKLAANVSFKNETNDYTGRNNFNGQVYLNGTTIVPNPNSVLLSTPENWYGRGRVSSLASAPQSQQWHDIFAFCKILTPIYETSLDGVDFSPAPLNKDPFSQRQALYTTVVPNGSGLKSVRWTWNGSSTQFAYSRAVFLVIGHFSSTENRRVKFESSADGINWITRHDSTSNENTDNIWYKITEYDSHTKLRLTLEIITGSSMTIGQIMLYTARVGSQGYGTELMKPYSWDSKQSMFIKSLSVADLPSKLVSTDNDGKFLPFINSFFRNPLGVDEYGNIRINEIIKGTDVPNNERVGLTAYSTSTYVNNGKYGWESRQAADDSSIVPIVYNNKNWLQFILNRRQISYPERSELLIGSAVASRLPFTSSNREVWASTTILVPNNQIFDKVLTMPVIMQWHDLGTPTAPNKSGRSPAQSLRIVANRWQWRLIYNLNPEAIGNEGNTDLIFDLGAVNFGKGEAFEVYIKWSNSEPTGQLKVWKNKKLVLDYAGYTCYDDSPTATVAEGFLPYFKFGIYNSSWKDITSDVVTIMDQIRILHCDTRLADSVGNYDLIKVDDTSLSNEQYLNINTHADDIIVEQGITFKDSVNGAYKKLSVKSGALDLDGSNIAPTNLGLGEATATTQPITNTNGTGFVLPSATSVLAGLMSAADKIKLSAITGTNTGNQSLDLGTTSGAITINGTGGNTINLASLKIAANSVFADGNIPAASAGLYPFSITTGSSNYPIQNGGGVKLFRSSGSFIAQFEFLKQTTVSDDLYFRTGKNVTESNPWDIVAGRNWVSQRYEPVMPNVVMASALGEVLSTRGYYTFTGASGSWKLLPISGNTGLNYVIMNSGTGNLIINSSSGGNDISSAGTNVSSITLLPGETAILYNNSLKWFRQF